VIIFGVRMYKKTPLERTRNKRGHGQAGEPPRPYMEEVR